MKPKEKDQLGLLPAERDVVRYVIRRHWKRVEDVPHFCRERSYYEMLDDFGPPGGDVRWKSTISEATHYKTCADARYMSHKIRKMIAISICL